MALNVTWGPTKRIDNGLESHVYACRVEGTCVIDGAVVVIQAEKRIDLRDDSATVEALRDMHGDRFDAELARQRARIAAKAESVARLRAIRSTGAKV